MAFRRATALVLGTAILLPGGAIACDFNPPGPLLQAQAYPGKTFEMRENQHSIERISLRPDLRLELHRYQCVDFIVIEYVFVAPRVTPARPAKDWRALASAEIERLKFQADAPLTSADLLTFLRSSDAAAACVDGSEAPSGQCPYKSHGGFVFKTEETANAIRIVATQYVSG